MAWTQTQIDQLRALIASGESSARYEDRAVTYRSLEDLRSVLGEIEGEVAGKGGRERFKLAEFSKGL